MGIHAWHPQSDDEWAVIFEDDLRVSPSWYRWLKSAYTAYGHRPMYAGASLQRQSLMPVIPHTGYKQGVFRDPKKDVARAGMFFYPLVGSQGFAPKAKVWRQFVSWFNCTFAKGNELRARDVSTLRNGPPLVTGQWWSALPPAGMWTQYFIYFSDEMHLYTLYHHLPSKGPNNHPALVAHMRAPGDHFKGKDAGAGKADNPPEMGLVNMDMPPSLPLLGWDAKEVGVSAPEGGWIKGELMDNFFGQNTTSART